MIKKLLLTLGVIILFTGFAYSQTGTIKGTVTDQTGEPLPYTHVYLKQDDKVVNYAMTDDKGAYQLFGIATGTYDIEANAEMTCKKTMKQSGVTVGAQVRFVDFKINCAQELNTVEVTWQPPLFDEDNTTSSNRLSGNEVRKTPGRSITAALSNLEGVSSVDGAMTSVRGNRADGQQMIIDGVRVRGSGGVSMMSIEEAQLIQGGVPAELGDGTSFTVITTKPASKDFHGSAEIRGSLDGYNNFLGAVSVSGPILKGKKRDDPARIGFLLSGEASYDHDNSPARGGNWRASQEIVDFLIKNPLRYSGTEFGVYITSESFHKQRVRNNAGVWNYLGQGKIEFLFGKTKNVRFSVGGSYEYTKGQSWSRSGALFNSLNGPESKGSTLRLNARLNHRVYTDTTGVAILKNIMYDINVSYTRVNSVTEDVNHKDRLFDYGYIGKFTSHMADAYQIYKEYTMDSINYYQNVFVLENRYDSLITFQPGTQNPDLVYYTQNFYDNFTPEIINDRYGQFVPYDYVLYQKFGALRNGDSPNGVYTLYSMPGTVYNGYSKAQQEAIGLKASISMNLQNHELKIGYEFEKLKYRGFSASPRTLWTLMRDKTNSHIKELDLANPVITMGDTITIWYPRLVNYDAQSEFDRNIRSKLGYGADEWIDIDNLAPSTFSLSDFAAEELLLGTSRS
ncbi:MAG: TonB-dependent receptor, partial [Bacteroidales bacterium]